MLGINSKVYSIILVSLLGLSAVLYLLFAAELISHGLLLNWCAILLIVATLSAVVFPIIGMAKDIKKAINSLIGIGALLVIFVIGYIMSNEEVYSIGDRVVEGTMSKISEAGLFTFYVMIVLAVGTIIYTEISKAFK